MLFSFKMIIYVRDIALTREIAKIRKPRENCSRDRWLWIVQSYSPGQRVLNERIIMILKDSKSQILEFYSFNGRKKTSRFYTNNFIMRIDVYDVKSSKFYI